MRPTISETMMQVAEVLARRGTCAKLQVGCVLVDDKGRILSTGYNGVHRGAPHCREPNVAVTICIGQSSPEGSDLCQAVHAETNALLRCPDTDLIHACYVTHTPCVRCVKELLNTGCRAIYYREKAGSGSDAALGLWRSDRRLAAAVPAAASRMPQAGDA